MALFVSASDENTATDKSAFLLGGLIAPEEDWYRYFAPAWQERVLDGPPPIPYLHTTDIRSRKFRDEYGLSRHAADARLDEAIKVIEQLGSLRAILIDINAEHFRGEMSETKFIASTGGIKDLVVHRGQHDTKIAVTDSIKRTKQRRTIEAFPWLVADAPSDPPNMAELDGQSDPPNMADVSAKMAELSANMAEPHAIKKSKETDKEILYGLIALEDSYRLRVRYAFHFTEDSIPNDEPPQTQPAAVAVPVDQATLTPTTEE